LPRPQTGWAMENGEGPGIFFLTAPNSQGRAKFAPPGGFCAVPVYVNPREGREKQHLYGLGYVWYMPAPDITLYEIRQLGIQLIRCCFGAPLGLRTGWRLNPFAPDQAYTSV
jgi:hypothetical protein